MFSTILVPLDGSDLARRALPYAASLAAATRARLILLHAYLPMGTNADDTGLAAIVELGELATELRRQGINAATWLLYEAAGPAIGRAVADLHIDLIVMSTHGRGGVSRLVHGSVAEAVLRRVAVPVMLVTAHCRPRWPEGSPFSIVVPLDGSAFAEEALGPARELAGPLQAELVLVHALESGEDREAPWQLPWSHEERRLMDEARRSLEDVAAPLRGAGLAVDTRVEIGAASAVIARLANDRSAALVVMATHGRGALSRLVLESVTVETLQQLQAPLLLVRPGRTVDQRASVSSPSTLASASQPLVTAHESIHAPPTHPDNQPA